MTIELPQELRDFVDFQVNAGRFQNSADAIVEAVRFWKENEVERLPHQNQLVRKSLLDISERLDLGVRIGRDAQEVFADLEARDRSR